MILPKKNCQKCSQISENVPQIIFKLKKSTTMPQIVSKHIKLPQRVSKSLNSATNEVPS